ncbi:unnamed protein product [Rhizophagus irregularis]|nr:unnamed protein product [Rhizophagus irregularis]
MTTTPGYSRWLIHGSVKWSLVFETLQSCSPCMVTSGEHEMELAMKLCNPITLCLATADSCYRNGNIWHHDTRVAQHKVAELIDHTSEVYGLKWNSNGDQLASGGNDNRVNIWDARASTPRLTKNNHVAAVKALTWCPWQSHILASGGGSYDRHIHFWNVSSDARVKSIDTGSQVTSIIWSKDFKELLSTHGFPNHNMTICPDNQVVATAASDENLKIWRVFQNARKNEKSKNSDKENTGSVFGGCIIR